MATKINPMDIAPKPHPIVKYCSECYHKKARHSKSKAIGKYYVCECGCKVKKDAFY